MVGTGGPGGPETGGGRPYGEERLQPVPAVLGRRYREPGVWAVSVLLEFMLLHQRGRGRVSENLFQIGLQLN